MLLNGLDISQKLPLPLGGPGSNLIYGSLGSPESPRHQLDRFSCFRRAQERDQQTHTADQPRYSICSNRTLLLTTAVMQPNDNKQFKPASDGQALCGMWIVD